MKCIGYLNFSGIASDSTGNTQKACELIVKQIPTIIILPDICHLLNNLAKDIGKLNCFKKVSGDPKATVLIVTYLYLISIQAISGTKSIAKYFSKLSFAHVHHLKLRKELGGVGTGFVRVANT